MARTTRKSSPNEQPPEADKANGCLHPREVYNLVGHARAEQQLSTLFENNQLHHAWLISGAAGIGKSTLAYRLIRRVLGGTPETQGQLDIPALDPIAQRVQSLGHGDFLLIRRPYDHKTKKLRSEIPITEIRKVSNFFSRKPSEGGWRVCLVDSIDELNRNAANALLKTLEEPPEKALLILLSKAPRQLLPTIRSRCSHLPLRPVSTADLSSWLHSKTDADAADIQTAISLANGAPGKAYALIQNAAQVLRPLGNFLSSFPNTNAQMLHSIADSLSTQQASVSYNLFWDSLQDILYAQAVYMATGEWEGAYKPIALNRTTEKWMDLHTQIKHLRAAQSGLNMNKKSVLLHALTQIAA